ncbi:insulin gene enhancer protein isl-1-like [Anneissia japonica]|uniref:insulin gene enhancer protein isl-1-like n=1 Tax=Anneissia japonica TaxID=1529436 RepID=UPI001425B21C|nr:insulin gene enhancer protein isl-1-like [Anneissia japonica]
MTLDDAQVAIKASQVNKEASGVGSNRRISMCVGCGGQIYDQYILRVAPDLEWHGRCLKCADCDTYLDETCTCFVRDGKPYCKKDYLRLFGTKCAKCHLGFSKNDFVMRARNKIYHIDCFRCVACTRQLIPGDEFALREDGLFCKEDHDVLEKAVIDNNTMINSPTNNNQNCVNSTHTNSTQNRSSGRSHKSDGKTTRVRTVLNEKQLHTLRTCYAANPRPDALMKEQLVEMTALSPRVIRVWFQNKRCKDKKRTILVQNLQDQQNKQDANRRMQNFNGVPMVASSPVRHDTQLQGNQVEVQSYQPPWKALTDFTMNNDLDHQPPFQQLVNFSENNMKGEGSEGPLSLPPTPDSTDRLTHGGSQLDQLSVGSD